MSGAGWTWSPDSSRLVFDRSSAGRRTDVFVVGTDGRDEERIAEFAVSPDWSPDGSRIAISHAGSVYVVALGCKRRRKRRAAADQDAVSGMGPGLARRGREQTSRTQSGLFAVAGRHGWGRDVLRGGRRDDAIYGLAGNDRIYGKGGHDWLSGGEGADLITAQDGAFDEIVCGPGRDRAVADRGDRVQRDCERVTRR